MGRDGSTRAVLAAHAKVNLFLAVGPRRADGYHDVTTILQAISVADEVRVSPAASGIDVTYEPHLDLRAGEDLVSRAIEAWRVGTGRPGGAAVSVTKRVPVGAGLGGGSSDAAAVLAALGPWDGPEARLDPALARVAAGLGADVPFFLGPGTRLMTGRGDHPADVLPTPDLDLVLVNAGVPVSTAQAYARFDEFTPAEAPTPREMMSAVRSGDPEMVAAALYNNLSEASCALVPEVRAALRFLGAAPGVLGCAVAGSGSTVFGVCAGPADAEAAAGEAAERGLWSRAVKTVPAGLRVLDVER